MGWMRTRQPGFFAGAVGRFGQDHGFPFLAHEASHSNIGSAVSPEERNLGAFLAAESPHPCIGFHNLQLERDS